MCLLVACGLLALAGARWFAVLAAPDESKSPFAAQDAQILAEIRAHSEVMQNLEYLSDEIGPRLTGSPQLKAANEWTAEMFRKYGLSNVHQEPWTIEHAWTRGTAEARIVAPAQLPLTIASAGWSPGTKGKVRGPVVYFDAKTQADFAKFRGKLKGAIVIYQEPKSLSPAPPENPYAELLRPMQAPPPPPGQRAAAPPYAAAVAISRARTQFFKDEGVAAVLRDADKPHALLNMSGIGGEKFEIGAIPTAFITGEGYRMAWRLLQRGPVELEIEMENSFSEKPVQVYNTVAEVPGTGKPDEAVIVGAHLDSWDLGTGTTDNGTGSMAVLEAARALAKLNLKPQRTIRFVLFTGEEQGLVGSKQYVEAHKSELAKISGVLVHDTGTGRVLSLGLHDNYQDRQIVDEVIAPLGELKLLEPSMLRSFGTDHASFNNAGVPAFWCIQDTAEYSKTHHSQSDTFDKVWRDDLVQGAQVLAAWAYNTAQLPEMLPRRPPPPPAPTEAPPPPPDPVAEMDKKIIAQVKADEPKLKETLSYLADRIGPRLTGSPALDQASHWTEDQFKSLGLSNVHLEARSIANSWSRGDGTGAAGKVISPTPQTLTVAAVGWSKSTNGPVQGSVVGLAIEKPEDLNQYHGKLKGAIILLGKPVDRVAPGNPLTTPWGEEAIPIMAPKANQPFDFRAYVRAIIAESIFLSHENVGAVIVSSDKMYGLLNMTVMSRNYAESPFPVAVATQENYRLLWRLLDAGPVQAEVNIGGKISGAPAQVYNTVAEIKGHEKPEEVVIIGAHLDSWDLGTGATDNGTGSMAVLEAARALQTLGLKPKRTIRFVLFTGEEQGLYGSRAYVEAHKDEMKNVSAVLVHDSGTGKVLTVGLMGNYGAQETMHRILYPLAQDKEIGLAEPSLRSEGGSDHVPFDAAGVPAFWCVQDNVDYAETHHSQADTLDRVRWDDLDEGAQVLAVFAYNVAELPGLLPRKPAEPHSNPMF
jgi:Zn-dependent M28 family amino/carboxypeptidase